MFGKVIEGMDVVDKIKAVKTGRMPIEQQMFGGAKQMMPTPNVPVDDVVIKSIRRGREVVGRDVYVSRARSRET